MAEKSRIKTDFITDAKMQEILEQYPRLIFRMSDYAQAQEENMFEQMSAKELLVFADNLLFNKDSAEFEKLLNNDDYLDGVGMVFNSMLSALNRICDIEPNGKHFFSILVAQYFDAIPITEKNGYNIYKNNTQDFVCFNTFKTYRKQAIHEYALILTREIKKSIKIRHRNELERRKIELSKRGFNVVNTSYNLKKVL